MEADLDGAADLLRVGLVQPGLARDVRDAPLLALLTSTYPWPYSVSSSAQ